MAKKQQGSDKLIQLLKRKLEIVTEKYDNVKKQFSKEKYIGLPQKDHNPKGSESQSYGDLTGFLDSPTKTPRKETRNVGFALTSLKEKRDLLKKNAMFTQENCEENMVIEEEEGVIEKGRTESWGKAGSGGSGGRHKKNISVHITRNGNGNQGVQSAKSSFGVTQHHKGFFHIFSNFIIFYIDPSNSFELKDQPALLGTNNGSLIAIDSDLTQNNQTEDFEGEFYNNEWKVKSSFEAHSASVYAICSYGNLLYSSSNKCFKVWSLDTMKSISEINAHPSFIKTMILWPEKFIKFIDFIVKS